MSDAGHTIGIGNFAPLAVNKALYPKLTYDAKTDLVPVVLIEKGPVVLVVGNDKSPYKSLNELVAAAKATPGKMSYASAGSGGAYHLAGEMFNVATGTSSVHIPYKGGGPATNDLLGGTVEYMFGQRDRWRQPAGLRELHCLRVGTLDEADQGAKHPGGVT